MVEPVSNAASSQHDRLLQLLEPDCRAVLRTYQQLLGTPQSIAPASGGFSGAAVFQVTTPAGSFAMRRWPAGSQPRRLAALHVFQRHLHTSGLREIAVPLSTGGTTLCRHRGALWHVEPWKPGRADMNNSPQDGRISVMMRWLARAHQLAADYHPRGESHPVFQPRTEVPPGILNRLEALGAFLRHREDLEPHVFAAEPHPCRAAARRIVSVADVRAASLLEQLKPHRRPIPLQPCLRDLWHDHCLWEGSNLTGVIDLSAARTDLPEADIARLLGSLVAADGDGLEAALAAYSDVRPLSGESRRLIRLLVSAGTLGAAVRWIGRIFLDREQIDTASVAARMSFLAARL